MEMKLSISLAIITAVFMHMHHLFPTAATTVAHTTMPNSSISLAGFSLQLVADDDPEGLDHTVRRGSDGFLHLQSLATGLLPHPSSRANSSAANITTVLPQEMMATPLRLPRNVVVSVGTGAGKQDYLFKIDPASPLIWMQCQGCDPYSPQRHPLWDTNASPTYHLVPGTDPFCRSPFKSALLGHACEFTVTGPGVLSVEGYLGHDQLSYQGMVHHNVPFGCAHKARHFQNEGLYAGVIGAASLGHGLTRFSYCLTTSDGEANRRGFLRFGIDVPNDRRYRTTKILPVLDAQESGRHYVSLVGVSLGARRLDGVRPEMFARRNGQGGCVIDLGTPLTVMAHETYDAVEEAVWSGLRRHGAKRVERPGYGLCFRASEAVLKRRLQSMSLHFSEEEAVLVISPEQLFLMMDDEQGRIACLAMAPGRQTIIGALQQVDTRFVFDLKDSTLSFASESCIQDTVEDV